MESTSQPYTILRIKRKRNEEPLDALVVESAAPRKKSRGGMGMFQFAQTVEAEAWEDDARRKALQEEIQRLAKENASKAYEAPQKLPSSPPRPPVTDARRYTIVNAQEQDPERGRLPTSPPVVISSKDVRPKSPEIKLYDAVVSNDAPDADPEMEKFLPMIRDYLTLHDIPLDADTRNTNAVQESDDYVWDVFYHRPASLSEWNHVAANVGTLTGLPPSLNDPFDSDEDDEVPDEADEDSNAEEYFTNDYPEEEESSDDDGGGSDAFHESSDHEM
ncbi:hypothetical protein EYR40_009836 [Pleurotus pulmonarius]|nr:hypothetical protein EYR38_002881 [Pleurotus pulmonarius]KAF4591233.1 hypothetical protein EYR40_009836 [Pleurotus pulmonarius]